MMKKLLPILFFLVGASVSTFAQKFAIVGIVADSSSQPLENATVLLLNATDSSLASFGRTTAKGTFELKNVVPNAAYLLKITFVGYEPYFQDIAKNIKPSANGVFDVGGVRMSPLSKMLSEAVVSAERDPVKIKGDTTEFNAGSFKVQPNAAAEDLIKKLPGMEVGKDGSVKSQGEDVKQVLINGKKFFGKDPKVALQNLPASAIEKIQVYDKKSDQAEFSGIDDGDREKTINLQLKKTYSQGTFGNVMGGIGKDATDETRYTAKLSLNSFSPKQQISVLGIGNNANKSGFTFEDYMGFTGASRNMQSGRATTIQVDGNNSSVPLDNGGTKGFQTTWAGGLNYNNQFSTKTELNGSYFFNDQISQNQIATNRVNFLPSGNFTSNATSNARSENMNHRVSVTLDQKIDTFTSFKFTSNVSLTKNNSNSYATSENIRADGSKQNSGVNDNYTEGSGASAQNTLLLRRRFDKKGRTTSANIFFNYNQSTSNGNLNTANTFYGAGSGGSNRIDTVLQDDNRTNHRKNYGVTLSFTEPLGNRQYLEANYTFSKTQSDADREVYNRQNGERQFNAKLSNVYTNDFDFNRGGLTYRINQKEWNFSTALQFQQTLLRGEFISTGGLVDTNYQAFLPNVRFNWSPVQGKNLRFSYETNFNAPSVSQLQPIRDNTDPLNVTLGNPNLKPEYAHRFNLGFNRFNMATFTSFFSNVNFTYTTDKITTAQTIDSSLRRISQPVNVRNDANLSGFLGFGWRLKGQLLRVNLNSNFSYGRGIGLINATENVTNRYAISLSPRINLNINDTFELSVGASARHNRTDYSLQSNQNQRFMTYSLENEANWRLPLGFKLNATFDYTIITGQTFGTSEGIPLLGASISKFILKQNRGELRFQIVDILNKNQGLDRTADVNYIQESRTRSLGRYALLTFQYNINPMLNQGGAPRGGMRMMMRN